MRCRAFAIMVAAIGSSACADEVTYGELPSGALSTNEVTEVAAEICRDHLFDPERAGARLPSGYRMVRAAETAQGDPAIAGLIKGKPELDGHAVGSLCFVSAGRFVVDGVRVNPDAPTPMAFWWVRAAGPRDPRMLGKVEWVQLASWYSQTITQRDRVLVSDPMAQFVDLAVTQAEPGYWRMRMVLADEVVEAEVRASGVRKPRSAPQPGFMSVPFAGPHADSFWVITYFGHHHQTASGEWRAEGTGVFSQATGISSDAAAFETYFQDGWSALSGVYAAQQ
jgi:hypothetical protein